MRLSIDSFCKFNSSHCLLRVSCSMCSVVCQTGCRSRAPLTSHSPRRIFSSRHARHTLICVRPGGPHTAVMAPPALAVQRSVWISQTPCRTTPLGSTVCIALSFLLTQGEPLDQPIACVFHETFAILGAEDRGKRRPQARLGFIEQHIRQVRRATVAQVEAAVKCSVLLAVP